MCSSSGPRDGGVAKSVFDLVVPATHSPSDIRAISESRPHAASWVLPTRGTSGGTMSIQEHVPEQSGASTIIALAMLLTAALPATVFAQAPGRDAANPCFRARPAPECSVFFITNAGGYFKPGRSYGGTPLRAIVDWGVMVNTSPGHAIGGSWFATLDEDDFSTGPAVRYRRWFEGGRSLDVSLGTPVAGDQLKAGSIFGLVKYNPVHWFGVGVRPEYLRRSVFTCGPSICTEHTATSMRVYGGVELGWIPGLGLALGGGAALALFVAALAVSN